MNEKLMACLTNPIKCKLFSDIEAGERTTAKKLAEANQNIPQATLYRYLKKMVEDGILEVVEERQVRNVREKVYGAAVDVEAQVQQVIANNSGEGYLSLFRQFCSGLQNEFQAYAVQDDIDILHDGSGFRLMPFYATAAEQKELSHKVWELIKSYQEQEPAPGRKLRHVAIVYTPPAKL